MYIMLLSYGVMLKTVQLCACYHMFIGLLMVQTVFLFLLMKYYDKEYHHLRRKCQAEPICLRELNVDETVFMPADVLMPANVF